MANRTAKLYIRNKVGYRKPPKRITDLPENEAFVLFWYEGTRKKAKAVGRFADEAQVALNNKEAELKNLSITGIAPVVVALEPAQEPTTPAVLTVCETVKEYLANVEGRVGNDGYGAAPKTLTAYRKRLSFLLEFDGNIPVTEVNRKYFERFRAFLRSRLENDRYTYNILQSANIFFRTLGITCCGKILRETGYAPKIVEAYKEESLNLFFLECSPEEKLVFKFFLHSMAREREVAHTEVADLLFNESVLWIQPKPWRRFRLKGKKSGQAARGRKVPMPRQFMERLKAYCEGKQPHDLLFTNGGGSIEGNFLARCQRIAKRAGLDPKQFGLHKFRKTSATMHYKAGVSVPTISVWLGHESVQVTMAYLDISDAASDHYVDVVSNGACAAWA
jgi:integrase